MHYEVDQASLGHEHRPTSARAVRLSGTVY